VSLIKLDGPEGDVIPIDKVRAALRIDHTTEDETLSRCLASAVEFLEDHTLQVVGLSEYELTLDRWPCHGHAIPLDRAPFRELVSVSYLPASGAEATVAEASRYAVRTPDLCGEVWFAGSFDRPELADRRGVITIRFLAGYEIPETEPATGEESSGSGAVPRYLRLPARIEQAALLLAGHWFENREATSDREQKAIELGAEDILRQLRVWR
jgi:uncharacterized phiE125 gp8 family phage protein